MTVFREPPHAGEFIVSEGNGFISREAVIVAAGADLEAGTVLGQITTGTASAVAKVGNAGNGAFGSITVGAAKPGVYVVTFLEPASNAGAFQVEDPDGVNVGTGAVAVAFTGGGLTFTIADGSADFAAGDQFKITVAAGSKKFKQFDPVATDGVQHAAAILWASARAASIDVNATVIRRNAEVNGLALTWPSGIAAADKAAAAAELAALGIIIRN